MKRKYSAAACVLLLFALLLTGAGLWNARGRGPLLQYVVIAPQGEGEIARLVRQKDDALEDLSDAISASAVTAIETNAFVSAPDAGTSAQATLRAGGEGFFEVFPRYLVSGRLLSETELEKGEKKAVLDEDLAFKLFPTINPVGAKITVGGSELEIVGVVRHQRRVGETDLYSVYAPVLALLDAEYEIIALSALPVEGSGAAIMFEDSAEALWQGGGFFCDFEKEALRAQLPLLYTMVIFGFAAAIWLLRRVNSLAMQAVGSIKRRMEDEYAARLAPRMILYAAGLIAAYAAVFGLMWLIGTQAVRPLYTFPEWVPENIVEWSAIRDVFWNLAVQGAKMTNAASGEMRALQFWAGTVRWGVLFGLVGMLLVLVSAKEKSEE